MVLLHRVSRYICTWHIITFQWSNDVSGTLHREPQPNTIIPLYQATLSASLQVAFQIPFTAISDLNHADNIDQWIIITQIEILYNHAINFRFHINKEYTLVNPRYIAIGI